MAGRNTRVDAGAGDDTVTAIIASGRARVSCGPGNDTVIVSRFAGQPPLGDGRRGLREQKKG